MNNLFGWLTNRAVKRFNFRIIETHDQLKLNDIEMESLRNFLSEIHNDLQSIDYFIFLSSRAALTVCR